MICRLFFTRWWISRISASFSSSESSRALSRVVMLSPKAPRVRARERISVGACSAWTGRTEKRPRA
ncbi:hypothetical protein D3C80_1233560 [compost metagenome]